MVHGNNKSPPSARAEEVDDGGRRADVAKRRFVSIHREAMHIDIRLAHARL
jgi:hypothetical protein